MWCRHQWTVTLPPDQGWHVCGLNLGHAGAHLCAYCLAKEDG